MYVLWMCNQLQILCACVYAELMNNKTQRKKKKHFWYQIKISYGIALHCSRNPTTVEIFQCAQPFELTTLNNRNLNIHVGPNIQLFSCQLRCFPCHHKHRRKSTIEKGSSSNTLHCFYLSRTFLYRNPPILILNLYRGFSFYPLFYPNEPSLNFDIC